MAETIQQTRKVWSFLFTTGHFVDSSITFLYSIHGPLTDYNPARASASRI